MVRGATGRRETGVRQTRQADRGGTKEWPNKKGGLDDDRDGMETHLFFHALIAVRVAAELHTQGKQEMYDG